MASKDLEILAKLREGDMSLLAKIYSQYRVEFIQWLMSRYSSEIDDAKDIYQQSIVILYENIVSGRLTVLTSTLKTYLFSIGKNKFKEIKKNRTPPPNETESVDDKIVAEERLNLIEACLSQLGEPCRSLLVRFYYQRNNVEQLCEAFGYKNIQSAKNQKYKCLERLRKMVMEQAAMEPKEIL